ncbi:MAG: AAA family ATPase, partial [Elusimicrobia bacterium]|nr:AAA family ATPase [Elusimicrobiota bacterium]
METLPIDFTVSEERAGFRLQRFETLNWGTFHKHVWKIEPQGHNSLLTGDIGSGKSTLVDALTTLLVPAQRIIYNQAAGAARRERDLLSYVRGYYKTEKDSARFAARAVSLRQDDTYSVILGYFFNDGYGQGVTLAQVFWTKSDNGQPERFYVVADRPLSVAQDFSNFGKEIADLRKRLRKDGVLLFDSFSQYAQEFRRRMEIRSDQALELFYQTVSLKSVGNLTGFVREHMLDEPQVKDRLDEIRRNFDNLNRAHMAVVKAKDQIGRLEPLV